MYAACIKAVLYSLLTNLAGVEPSPLLLRPLIGLLYQLWMVDDDSCGASIGMNE
jgi:hypothetical protein